jgi:RNA polymerase sigma-70 factor (ECF subfamily)
MMTAAKDDPRHSEASALRPRLAQHHQDAVGWSLACCDRDEELAHEVLHEAYVRVLDGRARYRGDSKFGTWLFGVIRLVALETRRLRGRRERELTRSPPAEAPIPLVPGTQMSQDRVELANRLTEALTKLSTRQREVVHLVFYQNVTIAEAARVMGVGVGAARTHYHRAKARLREELSKELVK